MMHSRYWPESRQIMDDFIKKFDLPFGFFGSMVHDVLYKDQIVKVNGVCWGADEQAVYDKLVQDFQIKKMTIAYKLSYIEYKFVVDGLQFELWHLNFLKDWSKFSFYKDFVLGLVDQPQIGYNGVLCMAPSYFEYLKPEAPIYPSGWGANALLDLLYESYKEDVGSKTVNFNEYQKFRNTTDYDRKYA